MGAHASPTGELTFENFEMPQENLIGQEGDGFKICMRHLNHTRLGCAAGAIGLAKPGSIANYSERSLHRMVVNIKCGIFSSGRRHPSPTFATSSVVT